MITRFKRQSDSTFVRTVYIDGIKYQLIVPVAMWEPKKVSRHVVHWIQQTKLGKHCTFKYGDVKVCIANTPEINKCTICDKQYKTRAGLLRHIKKYHNEETNERTISTQTEGIHNEESLFDTDDYETIDPSESAGYVYCFSCESMPGIYKIGMTTRNVEDRLVEANKPSTWKIPDDFKHILSKRVCNPYKKEQLIHKILKDYRVTHRREFFKLPLVQIKCLFALLAEASMDESKE